jgi:hypothetical protein
MKRTTVTFRRKGEPLANLKSMVFYTESLDEALQQWKKSYPKCKLVHLIYVNEKYI